MSGMHILPFVLYDYEYENAKRKEVEVSSRGRTSTHQVSKKDGRIEIKQSRQTEFGAVW